MFDDPISAAAALVYHAYRLNIERAGGRYNKEITADQQHWNKAAKLAIANNFEPARLVNALFMVIDDERRRGMTPRMLYTPASRALDAYLQTSPSPCNYPKIYALLKGQVEDLAARRKLGVMDIITDGEQIMPPWFRILYAPVLTRELVEVYMEAAKSELVEDMYLQKFITSEDIYGRLKPDTDNQQ